MSVDPLAEKYPGLSAYNYCFNNPVAYNDPDGRDGVLTVDGENLTVSVTINYSKEDLAKYNEALKAGADYTEDDFRQDFKDNYEAKNGEYEIDGDNYNVKFEITFNSFERSEDMPDEGSIPEGEMNLKFDADKIGAGDFSSNIITLKQSPAYSPVTGSTGGTFSHEVLHGLGVGHSSNETGALSSYASKRNLKPFEVAKYLTPAVQYAKQNNIAQGKLLITRYRQSGGKELPRLPTKVLKQ